MTERIDVLIIGAGPAGLMVADTLASAGLSVIIVERRDQLGGQLVDFTEYRQCYYPRDQRDVVDQLVMRVQQHSLIRRYLHANCAGLYDDGTALIHYDHRVIHILPRYTVVASGGYEKLLSFAGNSLPGVLPMSKFVSNLTRGMIKKAMPIIFAVPYHRRRFFNCLTSGEQLNVAAYIYSYSPLSRPDPSDKDRNSAEQRIIAVNGDKRIESITLENVNDGRQREIRADYLVYYQDLVANSQLLRQRGCQMTYNDNRQQLLPALDDHYQSSCQRIFAVGGCAGLTTLTEAMQSAKYCATHIIEQDEL